ncbi:MAG: D-galactarate dehydratase [Rhodobacteraceae bacterium]|nr:D-galactarate dehydratase [Paracoccaceae bacterium]
MSPDMPVLKPEPRPDAEVPVALPVSGSARLGTTIASLGDPAIPGLWMETPLTAREQTGQVQYQGSTVTLTLRPSGGDAGSGSRMSLLAMQAIGAPLTDLVEVTVTGAR